MTTEPAAAPAESSGQEGVVGALLALALGGGLAAVLDFGGLAGQGFRAGQMILAVAPWLLAWRGRHAAPGVRPLQGNVPAGWVLLLAGAVAALVPAHMDGPLSLIAAGLQAAGAAAVLLVLQRGGHFGLLGLFGRLSAGAVFGAALAAAASRPLGLDAAVTVSNVLVAAHLVPQLVHDLLVVRWARRTGEHARARLALEGVGMPFILWTLAGHLIIAPAILYFSPKPEVFVRGVGAAVALGLFGLRGLAGLYSRRGVLAVLVVATLYGVGLAVLVTGGRPY